MNEFYQGFLVGISLIIGLGYLIFVINKRKTLCKFEDQAMAKEPTEIRRERLKSYACIIDNFKNGKY